MATLVKFPARHVARAHTILSSTAFIVALAIGLLYHYKKIVRNSVAEYPQEFFPSVSATIGDWYPERNLFQIVIAFTSGPRLGLVYLHYLLHSQAWNSRVPTLIFISGILRTIACAGWVYVTSYDDGEIHDFFMISYLALNIPWMLGCITCAPAQTRRKRFFLSITPLVYFFIQHKVYRIPGAYTYYSFVEWSLIVFDIVFDSFSEDEFTHMIYIGDGSLTVQASKDVNPKEKEPQIEPETLKSPVPHNPAVAKPSFRSPKFQVPPSWMPVISFASSLYLAYIFWSIFTSLPVTLFYFSIWELGISGHELAILSTLSPILLSSGLFLSWARSRDGSTTLHAFSLLGLIAFVLDKPVHRLLLVFVASIAVVIKQVVDWSAIDVEYQSILSGLGLLLHSLSKHANHSNNPVWPIVNSSSGGYNTIGLALALLAIYEHHTRPLPPLQDKEKTTVANVPFRGHWLTAALPLGSLIFTLHSLLSESSTLISWCWTGYLNSRPRGPLPHVHGSLTFIAQSIGLLLALILISCNKIDKLAHVAWFAYGSAAAMILYRERNWLGYSGGLNFAIFIMSIIPIVFKRASDAAGSAGNSIGKIYFTAMLVYCLLLLASIWTVAYAFVPGGVYLRERTDIVMILQMASLLPAFHWKYTPLPERKYNVPSVLTSYSRAALACFSIASLLVTLYRTPAGFPQPFKPGPRIMTVGIWTIHFGFDNEGRDSQRLIRDVLEDMSLDVVGLLETDLHRVVFGNRDITRVLVEEMGYYVDLGPGLPSHTWGAVLLSKFPIISSKHHLLPSPHGELAPAIEAVLDVFGTHVTVVVAHNGQEEDPLDRELQSTELARIMAAPYPRPVLFLGYVVTKPHAPRPAPYEILVNDGKVFDIDKDVCIAHLRRCEYILYRGMYRTSYARISRGKVTDTELQIGQFVLPEYGTTVVDESEEARYLRSFKEDLPVDHWFPMSYYEYNGGRAGHVYHVFGTPLYYKIPKPRDELL
ncbi:Frag1/DRAM/Sfk1 family-domain-containing protein [Roridomyces roridus]|uniref:Frag1/DRAM/Sfk1 family-domain-containing protein n=1 Tax=Roridomyces roridus TaxID=1738132 RepID=A0AAD7FYV1_9AGAR|nr:Frag1/DRAM/Sfk1 family-domain-containing protein [Roridomyces roridus]